MPIVKNGGFVDIRLLTITINTPITLHYLTRATPHSGENQPYFLLREIDHKIIRSNHIVSPPNNDSESSNPNTPTPDPHILDSRSEVVVKILINQVCRDAHVWTTPEELKALKAINLFPIRAPRAALISAPTLIRLLRHFECDIKALALEAVLLSLQATSRFQHRVFLGLKAAVEVANRTFLNVSPDPLPNNPKSTHSGQTDDAVSKSLLSDLMKSHGFTYNPPWADSYGKGVDKPVLDLNSCLLLAQAIAKPREQDCILVWDPLNNPQKVNRDNAEETPSSNHIQPPTLPHVESENSTPPTVPPVLWRERIFNLDEFPGPTFNTQQTNPIPTAPSGQLDQIADSQPPTTTSNQQRNLLMKSVVVHNASDTNAYLVYSTHSTSAPPNYPVLSKSTTEHWDSIHSTTFSTPPRPTEAGEVTDRSRTPPQCHDTPNALQTEHATKISFADISSETITAEHSTALESTPNNAFVAQLHNSNDMSSHLLPDCVAKEFPLQTNAYDHAVLYHMSHPSLCQFHNHLNDVPPDQINLKPFINFSNLTTHAYSTPFETRRHKTYDDAVRDGVYHFYFPYRPHNLSFFLTSFLPALPLPSSRLNHLFGEYPAHMLSNARKYIAAMTSAGNAVPTGPQKAPKKKAKKTSLMSDCVAEQQTHTAYSAAKSSHLEIHQMTAELKERSLQQDPSTTPTAPTTLPTSSSTNPTPPHSQRPITETDVPKFDNLTHLPPRCKIDSESHCLSQPGVVPFHLLVFLASLYFHHRTTTIMSNEQLRSVDYVCEKLTSSFSWLLTHLRTPVTYSSTLIEYEPALSNSFFTDNIAPDLFITPDLASCHIVPSAAVADPCSLQSQHVSSNETGESGPSETIQESSWFHPNHTSQHNNGIISAVLRRPDPHVNFDPNRILKDEMLVDYTPKYNITSELTQILYLQDLPTTPTSPTTSTATTTALTITNHTNTDLNNFQQHAKTLFPYEITRETLPLWRSLLFHIEHLDPLQAFRLWRHCGSLYNVYQYTPSRDEPYQGLEGSEEVQKQQTHVGAESVLKASTVSPTPPATLAPTPTMVFAAESRSSDPKPRNNKGRFSSSTSAKGRGSKRQKTNAQAACSAIELNSEVQLQQNSNEQLNEQNPTDFFFPAIKPTNTFNNDSMTTLDTEPTALYYSNLFSQPLFNYNQSNTIRYQDLPPFQPHPLDAPPFDPITQPSNDPPFPPAFTTFSIISPQQDFSPLFNPSSSPSTFYDNSNDSFTSSPPTYNTASLFPPGLKTSYESGHRSQFDLIYQTGTDSEYSSREMSPISHHSFSPLMASQPFRGLFTPQFDNPNPGSPHPHSGQLTSSILDHNPSTFQLNRDFE